MDKNLSDKKCIPCEGGTPALSEEQKAPLKQELHPDWEYTHEGTRLKRKLKLKKFQGPLDLAQKIGKVADEQWHHPDLKLGFGYLYIEIFTHKIKNLVESDFIFAAKVDKLIEDHLQD